MFCPVRYGLLCTALLSAFALSASVYHPYKIPFNLSTLLFLPFVPWRLRGDPVFFPFSAAGQLLKTGNLINAFMVLIAHLNTRKP